MLPFFFPSKYTLHTIGMIFYYNDNGPTHSTCWILRMIRFLIVVHVTSSITHNALLWRNKIVDAPLRPSLSGHFGSDVELLFKTDQNRFLRLDESCTMSSRHNETVLIWLWNTILHPFQSAGVRHGLSRSEEKQKTCCPLEITKKIKTKVIGYKTTKVSIDHVSPMFAIFF